MNIFPDIKRFSRGLTLVELLLLVVIGLTIFFLPVFFMMKKEQAHAERIQCLNNLKQVGLASILWEQDHGDKFPDKFPWEIAETNGGTMEITSGPNLWRHFQVISNELSTPHILVCPSDKSRVTATNFAFFNNSNISYFLNLDATRTNSEDFVSGDRNITNGTVIENGILTLTPNHTAGWDNGMHKQFNNILAADGSVLETGTTGLREAITRGATTNRLLMPILGP
jgi:hypothetical protein